MTLGFYDRMGARVVRLLKDKGRTWSFTETTGEGSVSSRDGLAVYDSTVMRAFDDSDVQIGDKKYLTEASVAPTSGLRMTNGAESYIVMHFAPIGDTVVAWWIWARAG